MTVVARPKLWSVAFPPIPDCVPLTDWHESESRLEWLRERLLDDRVRRLFAVACAVRCLPKFEEKHARNSRPRDAIRTAERFADLKQPTEKSRQKLRAASSAAYSAASSAVYSTANWAAYSATNWAAYSAADWAANWAAYSAADWAAYSAAYSAAERLAQSRLLALMLPLADWDSRWESDAARGIARAMYANLAWDRAPILADALQDEGADGWILDALRDERFPGAAFRGVWVVDRLRGVR